MSDYLEVEPIRYRNKIVDYTNRRAFRAFQQLRSNMLHQSLRELSSYHTIIAVEVMKQNGIYTPQDVSNIIEGYVYDLEHTTMMKAEIWSRRPRYIPIFGDYEIIYDKGIGGNEIVMTWNICKFCGGIQGCSSEWEDMNGAHLMEFPTGMQRILYAKGACPGECSGTQISIKVDHPTKADIQFAREFHPYYGDHVGPFESESESDVFSDN